MITGFNTDIEHDGVTYHVQTEDKGLETPLLLTLVYTGGTILASKRSLYDDLIAEGFDEKLLAERLQRQHKLICAAIRSGRIEDLKLMSQREANVRQAQKAEQKKEALQNLLSEQAATDSHPPVPEIQPIAVPVIEPATPYVPFTPPPPPPVPMWPSQTPIMMRPAPPGEFEMAQQMGAEAELLLELVEDRDFRGGEVVALRIRVSREPGGEDDVVADAPVTVKVLGTAFRPLICSATTDRDGMAVVFTTLPRFTSGRAAILIRVVVGSQDAEMRRIILPS